MSRLRRRKPSAGQVVEIGLHQLVPSPNIPAGLSVWVVMAVAHTLRNAGDGGYGPCMTAPIIVKRSTTADDRFVISDGRHRWMAHWIAGKDTARCIIEE